MGRDLVLLLGSFTLVFGLLALAVVPFLRGDADRPEPEVATTPVPSRVPPPEQAPVPATPADSARVPVVPEQEPVREALAPEGEPVGEPLSAAAGPAPPNPLSDPAPPLPEPAVEKTPVEPPEEATFDDLLAGYALGREAYWDALIRHVKPGAAAEADARYPLYPAGASVAVRRLDGQVVRGALAGLAEDGVQLTNGVSRSDVPLRELAYGDRMRLDPAYRAEVVDAMVVEYLFRRLPDRCRADTPPPGALSDELVAAGRRGNVPAARRAGMQYLSDVGQDPDPGRAFVWLLLAAKWGDEKAQFNVGRLYYHGRGVERDEPLALGWITRAMQQGHEPARRFVDAHWQRQASYRRTAAEAAATLERKMQQEAAWLEEAARQPAPL